MGVAVVHGENRVIRDLIPTWTLRESLRPGQELWRVDRGRRAYPITKRFTEDDSTHTWLGSGLFDDKSSRGFSVDLGLVFEIRPRQDLFLDLEINLQDVDVLIGEIGSVGVGHVDGIRIVIDLHGGFATGPTRFGVEGLAAVRGSRVLPALRGVADAVEGDAVLLHCEGGTGQLVAVLDRERVAVLQVPTRNGDGPFDTIGRVSGQNTFIVGVYTHDLLVYAAVLFHEARRFHPTGICHQAMRERWTDPCSRYAHQCRHEQSN